MGICRRVLEWRKSDDFGWAYEGKANRIGLNIILQVKVSGSQPPKQSQRTAKPTAICEVCTASGKGVVKSGILKIRGCSGRKQCKIKDLRGVVR